MSTFKEMITVEKEVYEAVLRNSVRVNDLEAENQQLKELLLDCQQSFRGIKAQIEEYEYSMARKTAQIAIDEIDNAIGEKK